MDVRVDRSGGQQMSLAGEDLRRSTDLEAGRDAVHDPRIAGLADCRDAPVADADVRLPDAGRVDDDDVGDDEIRRAAEPAGPETGGSQSSDQRRLAHPIADHFAAAELRFVAVTRRVPLDLDDQIGVCETNPVARRRTVMIGVGPPVDSHCPVTFTRGPGPKLRRAR